MTQNEMLKVAFEIGYQEALTNELEKQALVFPGKAMFESAAGKIRGWMGRGAPAAGAAAPVAGAATAPAAAAAGAAAPAAQAPSGWWKGLKERVFGGAQKPTPAPPPAPAPAPAAAAPKKGRGGGRGRQKKLAPEPPTPQAPVATPPPAAPATPQKSWWQGLKERVFKRSPKPEAPAAPAAPAAAEGAETAAKETGEAAAKKELTDKQVAREMERARTEIPDQTEYAARMKELGEAYPEQIAKITSEGAANPLLSWGAPLALGTGGGYLIGDEQGAAAGAGLALGARFGAGPMLKRMAEQRGIAKTLGREVPTFGEAFSKLPSDEVSKAMMLSGGLGLGGGVAGGYLGKQKPKEPWYNQLLGLTPAVASLAVPYMMARGGNPQLISQLQGLTPAMPPDQGMQM